MELLICNDWIATHISKNIYMNKCMSFRLMKNLLRPSYAYPFRKVTSQLGVKKRLKTEKIHQSAQ